MAFEQTGEVTVQWVASAEFPVNREFVLMRYLPGRSLLLVFAILAVACGTIASRATAHDKALSLMVFPIFVFAAVMGLWQSGRLSNASDVDTSDE